MVKFKFSKRDSDNVEVEREFDLSSLLIAGALNVLGVKVECKAIYNNDIQMSFSEAVEALKKGKKVAKKSWGYTDLYLSLVDDDIRFSNPPEESWLVSGNNMLDEDYFIVQ